MPIFEYQCADCSSKYEIYHKSTEKKEDVICPKCGGKEHKKLLSVFSASVPAGSSHHAEPSCGTGSCPNHACPMNN